MTSGELQGQALERALRAILKADPANPQANLRLGYVLLESADARDAIAALQGGDRRADAGGRRASRARARARLRGAPARRGGATLRDAERVEPDNPVVSANLGHRPVRRRSSRRRRSPPLQRALTLDPDFHQARFNLAIAFARAGRRADAAREAAGASPSPAA